MKNIFIAVALMMISSASQAQAELTQEEEFFASLSYLAGGLIACSEDEKAKSVLTIAENFTNDPDANRNRNRLEVVGKAYGKQGLNNMISGEDSCSNVISIYNESIASN